MTPRLFAELAYLAAVIIVPAAVVSLLASTCAKRSAPLLFLNLVILVSCVAAITVAVAMRWLQPYRAPASLFHDIVGAFVSWAPLFLVPSGLVWVFAKRSPSSRWIPILAVLGTVMSLPIGSILGSWVQ
jgi:hypothetical protein